MYVLVVDKNLEPLDPCHPARARELLKNRRAAVFRRYPFTILLQDRSVENSATHPHRLKIDPGSKYNYGAESPKIAPETLLLH